MKNLLSLIIIFTLSLATPVLAYGQSTNEVNDETLRDFNVSVELGTQSAWNSSIPLIVKFSLPEAADRIDVEADANFGTVEKDFESFFPVDANTTYERTLYLQPERPGNYTVTIDVINWDYGENYSASETVRLTLDDNLVVDPPTEGYMVQVWIKYTVYILLLGGVGFASYYFGKKGIKKLKIWLQPPE